MYRNTWHVLKACKKSNKSQYLFQLLVKVNSMKISGQQTLDLKRSANITSDSERKQTLEFQEDHDPQLPVYASGLFIYLLYI